MEENALDKQNGGAEDRDQDIAPVFHKSHMKGQGYDHGGAHGKDLDNNEDKDDKDDNMDNDDNEWSLRKCTTASLDALAGFFGASNTVPSLLPALQEGLRHDNQWVRKANILVLGEVANGCKVELTPHLLVLHLFLLPQLTAAESMLQLRCIAAWTLARYALWTVNQLEMRDGGGGRGDRLWWGRLPRRSRCTCWTHTRRSRLCCVRPWGLCQGNGGSSDPVPGAHIRDICPGTP
jgi:hypothetical protein